ncbi:PilN domain-containing protein [bacterium]|nr:MAG: PilN domain-containing protein [bacterium]
MGVLINLLPDFKQAKQRESRRRQLAVAASFAVWVVCGVVVLLMFLYSAGQGVRITVLNRQIQENTKSLEGTQGLMDALNAQQHLASLGSLYSNRILFTKFFEAYVAASPTDVTIDAITVNDQNVLVVTGNAKNFAAVAKLQRAMSRGNKTGINKDVPTSGYFSSVNIPTANNSGNKGITFMINASVSQEVLSGN